MLGRIEDATRLFERLLSIRNDLGLLAEEYDPVRRRLLGNFPQGLSHIGLIDTAYNLIDAHGPARQRSERVAPTDGEAKKPKLFPSRDDHGNGSAAHSPSMSDKTTKPRSDTEMRAKALARWKNEGGSSA
jgi:hypothetical protein